MIINTAHFYRLNFVLNDMLILHGYGKRNQRDLSRRGRFVSVLALVLLSQISDQDDSLLIVSFAYWFDGSTVNAIEVNIALKAHIDKIVNKTGNSLNTSNFDLTKPLPRRYTKTGIEVSLRYWEKRVIVSIVLLIEINSMS